MSSSAPTNLRHLIDTFRILNRDDAVSTVTEERFPFQNSFKKQSFIVSDVDEELLLLVEFHNVVDLHSIKIHAFPLSSESKDENDSDDDGDEDMDDKEAMSAAKEIHIFKIDDLSKDFSDLNDMKPTHSLSLKPKKLAKGQTINLQKKSKIAVKFKKIRFLAILIKSNQNNTEKSYINGLILSGKSDQKLDYDIPYTQTKNKKKQKSAEIVLMFDKLDKKNVGLGKLLKTNQSALDFNISNDLIHSLLSYISRLPIQSNHTILHKIYANDNHFGDEWIKNTVQTYANNTDDTKKQYKIESFELKYSTDSNISLSNMRADDIDYDQKMSFALMKILCIEDAPKEIKLFLDKKLEFLMFHCMLVFHPSSNGNMYHCVEILKTLLQCYPIKVYEILTRPNYSVIQSLFKYALVSRIHEAKFGEFLLLLLLYNNANVSKFKAQWIGMLRSYGFLQSLVEIGCNPRCYSVDISNKYCAVIVTLLKQCATMKETAPLFRDNTKNILALVIERFVQGGLDKLNDKWYRINCVRMSWQIMNDLCEDRVYEMKRKKVIKTSENHLFALFADVLNVVRAYIPRIVSEIIDLSSMDIVQNRRVSKPLGLYRLQCLELFVSYVQIGLTKYGRQWNDLGISNINPLCKGLIEMALIHTNNNLFLVKFREIIRVLDKHCLNALRYMVLDCDMITRFIDYYRKSSVPSSLKSFIVTILWDIQKGEFFRDYVNANNEAKQFMIMVEKQIKLRKPTKV